MSTQDDTTRHRTLKNISIEQRKSKVGIDNFSQIPNDFSWFRNLELMVPNILAGKDLKELSRCVRDARRAKKHVIVMMGAHAVKCGLTRLVNLAMEKGLITALAINGACAIHDVEIALWGKTSEDVETSLVSGQFGVTEETVSFFNKAVAFAYERRIGLGKAICECLANLNPAYKDYSLLMGAHKLGVTVTIHVAIGTDVVHQHPEADGEQIGYAAMKDFRIFSELVSQLDGGVVINIGSAVILPEVFLKAIAVARNRGSNLGDFVTANFDMHQMYRPTKNIIERPRLLGARSFNFIGQHELLLPIFFASILDLSSR